MTNFYLEDQFRCIWHFKLKALFLGSAAVVISRTWTENYGNTSNSAKFSAIDSLRTILHGEEILFLGIIQSLFEANMYIFVFQWTPVLDDGETPLGFVFATFMVC